MQIRYKNNNFSLKYGTFLFFNFFVSTLKYDFDAISHKKKKYFLQHLKRI